MGPGEAGAAEAELPPLGGEEVLHQHVRPREQPPERRPPLRALEVERRRPLVPVGGDEIGADSGLPLADPRRPPGAGLIAAVRLLDLDHVRPEVPQQHGEIGTGEDARGVDDADPGEGALSWGARTARHDGGGS